MVESLSPFSGRIPTAYGAPSELSGPRAISGISASNPGDLCVSEPSGGTQTQLSPSDLQPSLPRTSWPCLAPPPGLSWVPEATGGGDEGRGWWPWADLHSRPGGGWENHLLLPPPQAFCRGCSPPRLGPCVAPESPPWSHASGRRLSPCRSLI